MYLVYDLEVETYSSHKRKASPFDTRNWVVARGWKHQGESQCSSTYHPTYDRTTYLSIPQSTTMLVGFNLKFDLLWEMAQNNPDLHGFFKRGGKIWCCQYAEYLLRAQHQDAQMASMDSVIESYGGKLKVDEVKALWEAGVLTSAIPEDLLIDYLIGSEAEGRNGGDIRNTELIFLGQIRKAHQTGMLKMIQDSMDGLAATTDMEFRGVKVDRARAKANLIKLTEELQVATAALEAYVPTDLEFQFNWGSRTHASCMIFGGTVKYQKKAPYIDEETGEYSRYKATERWYILEGGEVCSPADTFTDSDGTLWHKEGIVPVATFVSGPRKGDPKSKLVDVPGEIKERLTEFLYTFPGHTQPNEEWAGANVDGRGAPIYSTSGDVLDELAVRDIPFLKTFTKKNALDKEIGTYYVRLDPNKGYVGMLTCVQPHDDMLHHKLNHTSTVTRRLSSSDPNLQNLSRGDKSEVKAMFISRFDDGMMVEADYSQLEVVVQGVLSKDKNLCQALRDRVDFHCKRVAKKFSITYEEALDWCKNVEHPDFDRGKRERTKCKEFSFQRAYGAGAAAIAAQTGMDVEEVKKLIEAEEEMFPGVTHFNAAVEAAVLTSAKPFNGLGSDGVTWKTYRRGYWQAPTGTMYSFRSYDPPAWMKKKNDTFMPTELKNYPIQGTGGEFVQTVALGRLWRQFVSTDYYGGQAYLVNTVHDCVWADSTKSVLPQVCADIKRIMESIPEFYNDRYGMGIDVPFPVEVEVGYNMYELTHYHTEHA